MTNEKPKPYTVKAPAIRTDDPYMCVGPGVARECESHQMADDFVCDCNSAHAQGVATSQAVLAEAERAMEGLLAKACVCEKACSPPIYIHFIDNCGPQIDAALAALLKIRAARGGGA